MILLKILYECILNKLLYICNYYGHLPRINEKTHGFSLFLVVSTVHRNFSMTIQYWFSRIPTIDSVFVQVAFNLIRQIPVSTTGPVYQFLCLLIDYIYIFKYYGVIIAIPVTFKLT